MKWEIKGKTSFPVLSFDLKQGESIKSQPGSMLAMSKGLIAEGKMDGGVLKSIGRMFSGESFFMQHISAKYDNGWVVLSTPTPGDIIEVEVTNDKSIIVQKDGYLASTQGIDLSTKVQGLFKGLLSGEGFLIAEVQGEGTVFLETYGSTYEIDVKEGDEIIVDNGNLVAWESSLDYDITRATESWFSALTSGTGFVCKFKGEGKVWAQSCNLRNLAASIYPHMPKNTFDKPSKRE